MTGSAPPDIRPWLRARRGAARRRRAGYTAYVTVMVLGGWYGLYGAGLVAQIDRGGPFADHAAQIGAALPWAAPALALAAVCVPLADALWRGPVTMPRADADWLLPLPVPRGPLVRPWFLLSLGLNALAALLAGLAVALVLGASRLAGLGLLVLAWVPAAVCLALLSTAGALAVQRFPYVAGAVRLLLGPALLCALLLGTAAVQSFGVSGAPGNDVLLPGALRTAVLWSGPWGWAAQPGLAATGFHAPAWPLAAVLLVCCTGAVLLPMTRAVERVPASVLRARSRAAGQAVAGLLSLDLRAARTAVADGVGSTGTHVPRVLRRLRPPRVLWAAVLWRDVVGLASRPRRVVTAWMLLAGVFVTAGAGQGFLAAVAGFLGAMGAGVLLEPARLDAADPARARLWWPRSRSALAALHAVVPVLVLLLPGLPVAALLAPATDVPVLVLVLGAVPVMVAGALVAAYRPPTPPWLLLRSMMGAAGTVTLLVWRMAGQLVAAGGLALVLTPYLTGDGGAAFGALARCWPLAAVLLVWAARGARTVD
ncbi:hypothetical protein [Streptomyces sp. RFCAC02]|uniref:hypothetical protein n=1 Tax=Streptomyces sp. RFCAC02 TaxID=2499143 RepID=UPI00101EB8C6|nr:hypothetical protein [Streptomyces sp. RFCAC02]